MVQRYSPQIGEANLPQARQANAAGPAAYGAQVGAAVGGLGDLAGGMSDMLRRRSHERAKIDANNAGNEYLRELTRFLYDPNAGVFSQRKLGFADNATVDFDGFADGAAEEIAGKLSPEAASMFRAMSEDLRMPLWKQTSAFEAKEMEQFRLDSYGATIAEAADTVALAPRDEELFASQLDRAAVAFMEANRGASEETLRHGLKNLASDMDASRIEKMMSTDPVAAQGMIENSPYLTEKTRTKLAEKNESGFMLTENQSIVDWLVGEYGIENETAVLQHLHDEYSGEQEQQLVSLYKARVAEMRVKEENASAELRKKQEEYRDKILFDIAAGNVPSLAQVLADVQAGYLSMADYNKIEAAILAAGNRTKTEQRVRADLGPNATQAQIDAEVIHRMTGTTPEQTKTIVDMLKNKAMAGELTKSEIEHFKSGGYITPTDAEMLTTITAKWGQEQRQFCQEQRGRLSREVGEIGKRVGLDPLGKDKILDEFAAKVAAIPMDLPIAEYKKEVEAVRQNIVSDIIKQATEKRGLFGRSKHPDLENYLEAQRRYNAAKSGYEASPQGQAMEGYETSSMLKIPKTTAELGNAMLGPQFTITGKFGDARDGGSRSHAGLDFAAKKGTPIRLPDFGLVGMKIVEAVDNQGAATKGYGNKLKIEGTAPNGDKVTIVVAHMDKALPPSDVGKYVTPGMLVGTVGNSGSVIKSSGGDGSHLHMELFVGGKAVDPQTYLPKLAQMKRTGDFGVVKQAEAAMEAQKSAPAAVVSGDVAPVERPSLADAGILPPVDDDDEEPATTPPPGTPLMSPGRRRR